MSSSKLAIDEVDNDNDSRIFSQTTEKINK